VSRSERVRNQVCEGCWWRCEYSKFIVLDSGGFSEVRQGLCSAAEAGLRTGSRRHITTATVLGKMHEMKAEAWTRHTENCPHRGEMLPVTADDYAEWSKTLPALDVRVYLGTPRAAAMKLKTALRAWEVRQYYLKLKGES